MKQNLNEFSLYWHSAGSSDKKKYLDDYLLNENKDINMLIQELGNAINLSERDSFSFRNNSTILEHIINLDKNSENKIEISRLELQHFEFDTIKTLNNYYSVIENMNADLLEKIYTGKYKLVFHEKKTKNTSAFIEDTELLIKKNKNLSNFTKETIILNAVYFLQSNEEILSFKNIIKEIDFKEIDPLSKKYQDMITLKLPNLIINRKRGVNHSHLTIAFFANPISFEQFDNLFNLKYSLKDYMNKYFEGNSQKEKRFFHFFYEITFQLDKVLYLKEKNVTRSLGNGDNNLHRMFRYLDKEESVEVINYYISKGDKPFQKNDSGKTPFDILWSYREDLNIKKAVNNFLLSDCLRVVSNVQFKSFIKSCKDNVDEDIVNMFLVAFEKKMLLQKIGNMPVEDSDLKKINKSRI